MCMTAVSTIVAIGMMPLNLLIYSRRWTDKKAVIPFINIIIGLVAIIIPVLIGMFIKWKKERWTKPISVVKKKTLLNYVKISCRINLEFFSAISKCHGRCCSPTMSRRMNYFMPTVSNFVYNMRNLTIPFVPL